MKVELENKRILTIKPYILKFNTPVTSLQEQTFWFILLVYPISSVFVLILDEQTFQNASYG